MSDYNFKSDWIVFKSMYTLRTEMTTEEKLEILADAAKYDVACLVFLCQEMSRSSSIGIPLKTPFPAIGYVVRDFK